MHDCTSDIRRRLATHYSDMRESLNKNREKRPFLECVMRDIEEDDDNNYEDLFIRELAVDMTSGWRFWNYWTKESRLKELKKERRTLVDKSLLKCKGHREYYDLFNQIINRDITWQRTADQENCIRKYLVQKELILPHLYKFKENPRNANTTPKECEDIVKNMKDEINNFIENKYKSSECIKKIHKDKDFANQLLKVEVFSKLDLLSSDKSRERQDFTNALVLISYDTLNC